jgi:ABC-type polysaccharide/polyol phosphate transport system ATPase subunit
MNAITVHNLGKKFKLFASPSGRFLEYMSIGKVNRHTDFWALKDISFDIPTGTTLGILGQNGSGKSTLLSILAGVLYPSEGSFEINGKVSAILELGSGFHPEFSGRDNVFMYGSIMGLSKQQIDDRFGEIVQFSELGEFIDQPLRTYSSGMIVRLAFSVAVHVDADILIVDEALAVGDVIFQHRCFRKIREMQADGKTILYVGHDTEAVRNLCTSALLLDGGRIIERGEPNYVVNKYYALITDRERAYSEGNLIEHGDIPTEEYKTAYNFIHDLSAAKIICPPGIPVHEQTIDINSTPRKVIFAHPPSEITYSVKIEPDSSLAFAIGIMPGAWDKIPQGVKFDIEILIDGNTENIFSRVLQPKRNVGDRGWHNFMIPLERFSGKDISIILRTSGSEEDLSYCWAAWGWIKLVIANFGNSFNKINIQTARNLFESEEDQSVSQSRPFPSTHIRYGNKKMEIIRVQLISLYKGESSIFKSGETGCIKIFIKKNTSLTGKLTVGCNIQNKYSEIYGTNTRWKDCDIDIEKINNEVLVEMCLPLKLATGIYSITAAIACIHEDNSIEVFDRKEDCILFRVQHDKQIVGYCNLDATFKSSIDNSNT